MRDEREGQERKREMITREDSLENGFKPVGELTQDEYMSVVQNKDKGAE